MRSLSYLLTKYDDIKLYLISPTVCRMETDIKEHLDKYQIPWVEEVDFEKVLPQVDCVYMTRVQKERFNVHEDYHASASQSR